MVGIGTIINSVAIVIGGCIGMLLKNMFPLSMQDGLKKACGISVVFIAIAGAMEGMLKISGEILIAGKSMIVVLSIILGTFIGELIGIDNIFEKFGIWLKNKTGNKSDTNFINGFISASFTVCIGAMAIVGSIEDGLRGDFSILAIKSVLDFVIVAVWHPLLEGERYIQQCQCLFWKG